MQRIAFLKAAMFKACCTVPFECLQFADEKVPLCAKNIHYLNGKKPPAMKKMQLSITCFFHLLIFFQGRTGSAGKCAWMQIFLFRVFMYVVLFECILYICVSKKEPKTNCDGNQNCTQMPLNPKGLV